MPLKFSLCPYLSNYRDLLKPFTNSSINYFLWLIFKARDSWESGRARDWCSTSVEAGEHRWLRPPTTGRTHCRQKTTVPLHPLSMQSHRMPRSAPLAHHSKHARMLHSLVHLFVCSFFSHSIHINTRKMYWNMPCLAKGLYFVKFYSIKVSGRAMVTVWRSVKDYFFLTQFRKKCFCARRW